MIVERFSEGDTFLHTLDPRVKICIVVPYVGVVALSDTLLVAGIVLLIALFLVGCARLRFLPVAKSLKVLLLFLILLWIFLPLSISGGELYSIGPLKLSSEGMLRALSITLRSTAVVLLIVSLLSTSSVFSLVHAMSHLHMPEKLLWLSFLSYRYIYVLHVEYLKLREAMRIRGFKPGNNLHTYKTFGYLIGMLLIRSYERSERIYDAMLCRGFHGRFYLLDHFRISKRDLVFLIIMSVILMGVVWLQWIAKTV